MKIFWMLLKVIKYKIFSVDFFWVMYLVYNDLFFFEGFFFCYWDDFILLVGFISLFYLFNN